MYKITTLIGTSALSCLVLSGFAVANDFAITGGLTSTNGQFTDTEINGNDTVTLGVAIDTGTTANEEGINTTGDTNKVTVSTTGSIATGGLTADGILNTGNTNTTNMSGTITTSGNDSSGILNKGNSNTTNMSGSITTTGTDEEASGIINWGNSNTTNMSGSITTSGEEAFGIWDKSGNSNTTNMSGTITTSGRAGLGIAINFGNSNTVTMSGSIVTSGEASKGILTFVSNNNATNVSGNITTSGKWGFGIHHQSNSNTTTLSAASSIVTTGEEAGGIVLSGDNNTVEIAGTVSATGTNTFAFGVASGDGNSFILNEGAKITGQILAAGVYQGLPGGTNNKLIFNLGKGASYAYHVAGNGVGTGAGQWTFSDQNGKTPTVTTGASGCNLNIPFANTTVCNLVTSISSGNAETQGKLQHLSNNALIGSLRPDTPSKAPKALSFIGTPETMQVWAKAYSGSSKRATSTTVASFDTRTSGITIGAPIIIGDSRNIDLVFNTSMTNLDIGLAKDQQITAKSYNLGVTVSELIASDIWDVSSFGFIGRNSYDGKRKVLTGAASEEVTSSYSGTQVMAGIDAEYSKPIDKTLSFRGGVNANLSSEKLGAYSESKYFTWAGRRTTQAAAGITGKVIYEQDTLSAFAEIGAQRSSSLGSKTASYTNNGVAGTYTNSTAGDTYRTASVGFTLEGDNGMHFTGSFKGFSSTGGVRGSTASLGINWKF